VSAPPPNTPQLRPLAVGEVLDAGFRLLRMRFGTLVLCTLVIATPLLIVSALVVASTNPVAYDFSTSATTDGSGSALVGQLVDSLLRLIIGALVIGACFKVVGSAYLGEPTTTGESLRFAFSRLAPLIGAYILLVIVVGFAFVALIIPGIYVGVRLSQTFAAVIFERAGPGAALGRSWSLVGGNWWRTFGIAILTVLLTTIVGFALGALAGVLIVGIDETNNILAAVVLTIVDILSTAVTYPLAAAIFAVYYFDLRVRKEGFDLELLARGIDAPPPERPAPPAEPAPAGGGGFAAPEKPSGFT
jgi:hypothetical protein